MTGHRNGEAGMDILWRRAIVPIIALGVAAALDAAMWQVLAPGGWTAAKLLVATGFFVATPWVGFCAAQGIIGFTLLLRNGIPPDPPPIPGEVLPMTALAVTVRSEDMDQVLPPLAALLADLAAAGVGDRFVACILSDTPEAQAAAEAAAIARFAFPLRYRRRTSNDRFKAGNIMDFLDHHAAGLEAMVVLDADSRMSAAAVLRLVRTLHRDPNLAIVQHLAVGLPATAAFPRLFQFGMRAGMRTWATALAWWQADESCYWGHNAAIRIAAFRWRARLPLLPDGRPILSHDQIEAAMLAGAGWGVRLLAVEDGSAEANPPALPEFVRREMRWLAGNLEYRHLLRMDGLRPMGRWQLVQAILLFGCSPFYLLVLAGAALAAATDRTSPFPAGWAAVVTLGWAVAIYAPKLLGYLEVMLSASQRRRYGGAGRFMAGVGLETAFALLIDPITLVNKTATVVRLLAGRPSGWAPQNRGDRGVSWMEAARLFWPHTLLGCAAFAGLAAAGPLAVAWAVPLAGGLLVAIPFCVATSSATAAGLLRDWRLAAIPEELTAATCAGTTGHVPADSPAGNRTPHTPGGDRTPPPGG